MLTPQAVAERTFTKAKFGGYTMQEVDDFLDQITKDYTALFEENASLKGKLKVLADSANTTITLSVSATEEDLPEALVALAR